MLGMRSHLQVCLDARAQRTNYIADSTIGQDVQAQKLTKT